MPRPPRLLLSHSYYHIMTRGNNRNQVFKNSNDYLYYLDQIHRFKKDLPFDLYHYCLMPNHVHLQIRTQEAENFSLFMKKINLAYFFHFKTTYGWVGHFWQDRFKSQPVGKDAHFIQCGKYIELNPVRAGIVSNPEEYQYSSYSYYAQGHANDLITEDLFYPELGKNNQARRKKYRELLISQDIIDSYQKNVWGRSQQRYNERRKIRYHQR